MSTLQSHGTIAFEPSVISDLIEIERSDVSLARWLMMVPQVYRAEAERGVHESLSRFLHHRVDDSSRHAMASALHDWLMKHVEPKWVEPKAEFFTRPPLTPAQQANATAEYLIAIMKEHAGELEAREREHPMTDERRADLRAIRDRLSKLIGE